MNLAQSREPTIAMAADAFLRPLAVDDVIPAYVDGLNDPEVNRFLVGPRRQRQTFETVRAFVRDNWEAGDSILFGIFIGGALRGTLRLHDIRDGSAYMGIALFDRSVWGQGWARRTIAAVARHATEHLGVREIRAGIEHDNAGSQHAFGAAGFECVHDPAAPAKKPPADTWVYAANSRRVGKTAGEVRADALTTGSTRHGD